MIQHDFITQNSFYRYIPFTSSTAYFLSLKCLCNCTITYPNILLSGDTASAFRVPKHLVWFGPWSVLLSCNTGWICHVPRGTWSPWVGANYTDLSKASSYIRVTFQCWSKKARTSPCLLLVEHDCIWQVKTWKEEAIACINLVLMKVGMKVLTLW